MHPEKGFGTNLVGKRWTLTLGCSQSKPQRVPIKHKPSGKGPKPDTVRYSECSQRAKRFWNGSSANQTQYHLIKQKKKVWQGPEANQRLTAFSGKPNNILIARARSQIETNNFYQNQKHSDKGPKLIRTQKLFHQNQQYSDKAPKTTRDSRRSQRAKRSENEKSIRLNVLLGNQKYSEKGPTPISLPAFSAR